MSEGKTLFMTEGPTFSRNAVTEVIRANLGIIVVIAIIGAVLSLLSPVFLTRTTFARFCSKSRPTCTSLWV